MCRRSLVVAPLLFQEDPFSVSLQSIAWSQHNNAEKRKEARGTICFLWGGRGRAWPEPLIMITGRLMKASFSRCPHDVTCQVWEESLDVSEKKEHRFIRKSQTELQSGKAGSYFPNSYKNTRNVFSLWLHYSTDIWRRAVLTMTQIRDSSASWEIVWMAQGCFSVLTGFPQGGRQDKNNTPLVLWWTDFSPIKSLIKMCLKFI